MTLPVLLTHVAARWGATWGELTELLHDLDTQAAHQYEGRP